MADAAAAMGKLAKAAGAATVVAEAARRAAGPDAPETEGAKTRRVVLKRERVLVVPEGVTVDPVKLAAALGIPKTPKLVASDAWVVVGEFEGATMESAIEKHAGKAGTPDAKLGTFKAPTARSFKGGVVYKAPPKPLVERTALED
jgi:hypothetical protein